MVADHETEQRKRDHLRLFREFAQTSHRVSSWLECVKFVHSALPELNSAQIELNTSFAGHALQAPLFITGMTGGTHQAHKINCTLARVAQKMGIAFGLGSGRAMIEDPNLTYSYDVRPEAPDVFLAWNLGGCQLVKTPLESIQEALTQLKADAICIHLNPAQELVQAEGDRDFRGILAAITELTAAVDNPVIVKETGAGLSRAVGARLHQSGVRYVDVAGCGGTSWVGVEVLRRHHQEDPEARNLWDWGIPTAAAICELAEFDFELIGSGGIRNGLDIARVVALGAKVAGVAAPVLEAYYQGGQAACETLLEGMLRGLRNTMLLTGCGNLQQLRQVRRVITEPLQSWLHASQADRG